MPNAEQFAELVEAGDVEPVAEVLAEQPGLAHQFVPLLREWGEEQWLPLHRAAYHGHVEFVAMLLDVGAKVDSRTRYLAGPFHARCTALHFAASGGYGELVKLLLERGATLEVLDAHQATPLLRAARYGRAEAVHALLMAGADPERREESDRNALHLAILGDRAEASGGNPEAAAALLIDHGCDLNVTCPREPDAYTPLHRCVSRGPQRWPTAARLLDHRADASLAHPQTGRTPLMLAEHLVVEGRAELKPFVELLKV